MTRAGQNRQSDGDPPSCVLTAPSSVLANGAAKMKIPILAFWAAGLACAFADGDQGLDIDGELIHEMSEEMTNDKNSRDGIEHDLFPLTYHQQLKYDFKLLGAETYRGRPVYRVSFEPKRHQEFDEAAWRGEALIDRDE